MSRNACHLLAQRQLRLRLLVTAVALVVQLVCWATPVYAGLLDEAQDTLAELTRRALSIKESILNWRQQEDDILDVLAKREPELEEARAELESLVQSLSGLEAEIASLEQTLASCESEARALASSLEDVGDSIQTQLRYLQKHGRSGDFLSFLVMESLAESQLTVSALEQVLYLTGRLASDYSARMAELQETRAELLLVIKDLDTKKTELSRMRELKETALSELSRSTQETRSALESARCEIADYEQALRELEESSAELQAMIEREEREAAERERKARERWVNSFLWPISPLVVGACVLAGGSGREYPGIDIETEGRADVIASRSGQISHSGWVDGYGSTVVINHGSGYSTIYAHCHNLKVAAGDFVLAGDVIAEMGPADSESPPCLRFEIRKDGLPLDPMEYLE